MLRHLLILVLACLLAVSVTAGVAHPPTRPHERSDTGPSPSPSPSQAKRQVKKEIIPITEAFGAQRDLARCPEGTMACPIVAAGVLTDDYECLEPETELYSCGGCSSLGTGQDCTVIPNALAVGCETGACQVYSCELGYIPNDAGTGNTTANKLAPDLKQ